MTIITTITTSNKNTIVDNIEILAAITNSNITEITATAIITDNTNNDHKHNNAIAGNIEILTIIILVL